jgi:hypothetical protein
MGYTVLFNPKFSRPALGLDYRRTSVLFIELVKKTSAVHGTVMFFSVVLILCQIEVRFFSVNCRYIFTPTSTCRPNMCSSLSRFSIKFCVIFVSYSVRSSTVTWL